MRPRIHALLLLTFILQFSVVARAQVIIRFAGDTTVGFFGDGGPATSAKMNQPSSLARDAAGNIYIGEGNGAKIRKVDPAGTITTIAGNSGTSGYTGDHGPATAAELTAAEGLAIDAAGNLYFADFGNNVIRMIDGAGVITTFAGTGTPGYLGDGGAAATAEFNRPIAVKFDAAGNLYVSDWNNHAIRKITPSGTISTVAGTGVAGYSGDGFAATTAKLHFPYKCAFDAAGNLYIADGANNCIRMVNTTTHIISTAVGDGSGTAGFFGDGGAATTAKLSLPSSVAFDAVGNMFVADRGNSRIREVSVGGMINTVVGIGSAFEGGDGGPATACTINSPFDIMFDPNGNLYSADINGNVVREVVALPKVTYTAPASICLDSCTTLTGVITGSVDSLRWNIPGATLTSLTNSITTACFPVAGTYSSSIYVHNISGSDTVTKTIVVNPVPHPSVTNDAGVLSVPNVYASYLWYNLIYPISSATTNTYTPVGAGAYYVMVDSGGCPGVSDTILFYVAGVKSVSNTVNNFWLSQSGNDITLHAAHAPDDALMVAVYDATGRQVLATSWTAGDNATQLSGIAVTPGLYMIRLSNRNTSAVLRWIK